MESSPIMQVFEHVLEKHGFQYALFYKVDGEKLTHAGQEHFVKPGTDGANFTKFAAESEKHDFVKGKGAPGRVWETKTFEWTDNVQNLPGDKYARLAVAKELGMFACMSCYYTVGGVFQGVIEFFCNKEREIDDAVAKHVQENDCTK